MALIAAIDQGTTSTRCLLFKRDGIVASAQREHRQIFPQPGWVEHDPAEIWQRTQQVVSEAIAKVDGEPIAAIGIANQRETAVAWDRETGQPLCNAIVWQDTRTADRCAALSKKGGVHRFAAITGLPLATYFSATKFYWMLANVPTVREAVRANRVCFGTIDSWLIWNLTGAHVTDVTNASRTQLMNLHTLEWDDALLAAHNVPREALPRITSSSSAEPWGMTRTDGCFNAAIPVCGNLGDQQAALLGQLCTSHGEAKSTYGTGCFLLMHTGTKPVTSHAGLLTTIAAKFDDVPATYALEGSVAVAGALVQWLRDQLGIISSSSEIEALARSVTDNGGVQIVPAFSGLFAPHWRADARGVIVGLTAQSSRAHIARAVLEATALQTCDVVDAMRSDCGSSLPQLKVDGGMCVNELLMQFQADILNTPVVRPAVIESTAAGAAYAAGLAVGYWRDLNELKSTWRIDRRWEPRMSEDERAHRRRVWAKAVERSLGWVE